MARRSKSRLPKSSIPTLTVRSAGNTPIAGTPKLDQSNITKSSTKGGRFYRWISVAVDNKPWWAIILVAVLSTTGAEFVKAVPNLIAWTKSFYPRYYNIYVWVTDKDTGKEIDGAKVSIKLARTALPLNEKGETQLLTTNGLAIPQLHIMPGPGYLISVEHKVAEQSYVSVLPTTIQNDEQFSFTFDPNDRNRWSIKGSEVTAFSVSAPTIPPNVRPDLPKWMKVAYGELGTLERTGKDNSPRVIEYIRSTNPLSTAVDPTTVDWSSAFVNWVMLQSGITGNRGSDASWLQWGTAVDTNKIGCIVVIERGNNAAHVGFLVGAKDDRIQVLGGNQSDSIKISSFPITRLLGCRWPSGN